jgi:hypothetical protein
MAATFKESHTMQPIMSKVGAYLLLAAGLGILIHTAFAVGFF